MAAIYVIDRERGLVISQAVEALTYPDFLDHDERLAQDPQFHPGLRQLFDFRSATGTDITPGRLRNIAERDPFGAGARRAFVFRRWDPGIDRLLRLYVVLTADRPFDVALHQDVHTAWVWMGLPEIGEPSVARLDAPGQP